jgi:hypothetical protein
LALFQKFNFLVPAILGAFTVKITKSVDELGKLFFVHHIRHKVHSDISPRVGMRPLVVASPNALESVTADTLPATHQGSTGSLYGNVHAVKLNVASLVIASGIVLCPHDSIESAHGKLSLVALGFAVAILELLYIDFFYFLSFLSFFMNLL